MSSAQKTYAVIGAGPMGLSVAYELCKRGQRVTLFEADDRLGGMAACFDFGGLEIERYYHFHCTSDVAVLDMLAELGMADKMHWVPTKMGYYFQNQLHPWGNPQSLLTFPHLNLISKFRYGFHAFVSTKRSSWKDLDKISAKEWVKKWIGQSAYDVLWKTLFEYKFYQYQDDVSAAWIWDRIHRIGNSRYNIWKEKLGYIEGGSQTLMNALGKQILAKGGIIKLAQPVTEVVTEKGGVKGVQIADGFEAFDKVISTVPLPYVSRMIPSLPQEIHEMYGRLTNLAVVCVIAKLTKPLTDCFWVNINDPNMDIPGLVEYSHLRPLNDSIVYVPFYMPAENPAYQESDEAFANKVRSYLVRISASLTEADIIDIHVHRYRFAQPLCRPGHLSQLPPCEGVFEGLWVADTSYYYPHDRGISESFEYGKELAQKAFQT